MHKSTFWNQNIDEIQKIFDEETEAIISEDELNKVGDRFYAQGYRLIKISDLQQQMMTASLEPCPDTLADKIEPLANTAIAILRENLGGSKPSSADKTHLALEVLKIIFSSKG
ncbi:hypothetical protein VF04_04290 [Nostoc linckia z7]|uniref:Uncharacterized protein n=2 Tax=Nostoc linckia TaxID=92942 RepID=A0A9Q5ZG35_NOSLI|nr:hypothetical protein [Nostoc linckia]PHK42932.1 hypothetical protein VF12_00990 [Nostoc linckia z15]PHK48089.1 hypothetical protein VF13_01965 [Nostoc linckia z16]PHJ65009.1 hypothetical protein VF02_11775 [Nostoc linckia z1]PHJ70187.1 hypothetical protein VF05_11935 [Nostoc linckia z3]PHJ75088.1 hypothetical protein VF03_12095 [Nostoc linckia z2]